MFQKIFKILIFVFFIFFQNILHSKNIYKNEFNQKNLSSYLSALISYDNRNNSEALKFFESSRLLTEQYQPYFKKYIFSLVVEGKINKAIYKIKNQKNKETLNFFEVYFLLTLDSLKNNDFIISKKYLKKLSDYKNDGTFELIIYETLKSYLYLFENNKILVEDDNFLNLSIIKKAFQNCYLGSDQTKNYFVSLLNNQDLDYSRYLYFYIDYLIEQNQFKEAKKLIDEKDYIESNLLISQTKSWIDKNDIDSLDKIFSCKNREDLLGEFFFLIGNLHSNRNNFVKSNFYLNISEYLNPKFKLNYALAAENYFSKKNYKKTKKILRFFNKDEDIYYWFSIKKKAEIISEELNKERAFVYLERELKKIDKLNEKVLFDMANISKSYQKYDLAIEYYNKLLSQTNEDSNVYADLLYKRGSCYERLNKFKKSDEDLLKSLLINPDDAYVLNYLAYSWLERNHKIDVAIEMLQKAHDKKKDDPYILDSVGWAYYLIGDFIEAEKYMNKAIQLMPTDPVVNDHYGDILWQLDRKIQARYFWNSVLKTEDIEKKMKDSVKQKLFQGPKT